MPPAHLCWCPQYITFVAGRQIRESGTGAAAKPVVVSTPDQSARVVCCIASNLVPGALNCDTFDPLFPPLLHNSELSSQVLGVEGVLAGSQAARQHPAPQIIEKSTCPLHTTRDENAVCRGDPTWSPIFGEDTL